MNLLNACYMYFMLITHTVNGRVLSDLWWSLFQGQTGFKQKLKDDKNQPFLWNMGEYCLEYSQCLP